MKTLSEFLIEVEQQSGALAAHLARTAADRAAKSGTVGGTVAKFKPRPKTGLGARMMNLAKRAKQSIKNTGKGTDTTYRGKGAGRVEVTGKKTEPKGPTKALPAAKKTNQVSGSPQRKALPSGSSSIVKRKDTRPKAPRPSSGIQPVKVRVIDDKKLKPSNQKQLPPAKKSLPAARS
jgi:hypothetical protein|tara:strand:+ start:158 stop:688 length:531 start_codon:yes stop_codon:yes gene_type:complete